MSDRLYVTARNGSARKLELRALDVATGRTLERSWVPGGGSNGRGTLLHLDGTLYLVVNKEVFAYPTRR